MKQISSIKYFFVALLFPVSLAAQIDYDDILDSDLTIRQKIDSILFYSDILADNYLFDSSLMVARLALDLAEDGEFMGGQARAEYSLGYTYDLSGQLNEAINHYEKARLYFEKLDNRLEVANCMNAKGVAAYFKGDFELSLQHYLPTITYCEDNNIESILINTLNNTGVIYRITHKQEKAINTYKKVLDLSRRTDNAEMIATSLHNLGVAYNFLGKPDTAISYLDTAIVQYQLLNNTREIARSTIARGETYYLSLKDFTQARKDFLVGFEKIKDDSDQELLSKTLLLLGQVERDDKKYKRSEEYFLKGLQVIENTQRQDLISEYYKEMIDLYDHQGSISAAYEYQTKYIKKYQEILSSEKLAAIEELQTQYETKEKEQEIKLLNAQNQLQESRLSASRNMMFGLSLGLLILAGLLTWLYRLNIKVKKSADEKDTLLREIHHRVKNNLQVISALLTLQSSHLKDAQAKSALQEGQDRVQSMALIHKDLYQHDNLKGVNTKDYLEQLIDNLLKSYRIDESDIEVDLNIQELNLDVDTMIPLGLMINELISNALKHAFDGIENRLLMIKLIEENNTLLVTIADNGVGVKDLSQMGQKSFGYSLVNSFARKLDAEMSINQEGGFAVNLVIHNFKKI